MREPYADDRLSALLDGELSDAEKAAIEAEVARDADLRRELDELGRVRAFLRKNGPAEAPPDFLAKVEALVENEPMPANSPMASFLRRPFGLPIEGLAVAAAALLVVVGAVGVGGGGMHMAAPQDPPEVAAPPAPAAAAPQQMVDPNPDGDEGGDREIDIQGVRYGEEEFGRGVTAKDLGTGTTGAPDKPGATTADFGPAPGTTDGKAEPSAPEAQTATEPPRVEGTASGGTVRGGTANTPRSSWSYRLTVDHGTILADLQSLAGQHGGHVIDSRGAEVDGGETSGGSYYVLVPKDRIASIDTWLAKMGADRVGEVDASMYPSDWIAIGVNVTLFDHVAPADPSGPKPRYKGD